jgi:uncharacterized protein YraI
MAAAAVDKPIVLSDGPAYLRAGPGPNYPVVTSVTGGAQLVLETREGEWYLVTAPNGQKGYVYRKLLQIKVNTPPPVVPPTPNKVAAVDEKPGEPTSMQVSTTPAPMPDITLTAARPTEQSPASAKSPALIQLIEGRESDLTLWLSIALAFFLIGWICGGNYYLRRDRLRRTRLRF